MNLKQHNNIVQKLIEQIELKDKQITTLTKQLNTQSKQITSHTTKPTDNTQTQKLIQKRISQLNKQHQSKLSTLKQQLKTITQQNTQLKQRLSLKMQIQTKDRQRMIDVLKRNMIQRKPGSKEEEKICVLIGYYQEELGKKSNMIETLKRQVKALSIGGHGDKMNGKTPKGQQLFQQKSEEQQPSTSIEDSSSSRTSQRKGISLTEHNKAISALNKQLQSLNKRLKDRTNQLQQLKTKYNQLTYQYYRVVNQCGVKQNKGQQKDKTNPSKSQQRQSRMPHARNKNADSFGLGWGNMLGGSADNEQSVVSVSVDLEKNFKKFNNDKSKVNVLVQQQQQQQEQDELQYKQKSQLSVHNLNNQNNPASSKLIQSIIELLHIATHQQILPTINQLITKASSQQINQQIITTLHQFLYSFGLGKMAKTQMIQALSIFIQTCNKWIESNRLLEELCMEIGANKSKLIEKVNFYISLEQQYAQKMRTATFLNSLNKSQKLLEFINFFELDKSDLQLPQQLRNIYQQLKQVDKFVKMANSILGVSFIKDNQSLQNTLNVILRKLERYSSWEVELEKENERKKNNIKKKQLSSTHLQTKIKNMQ